MGIRKKWSKFNNKEVSKLRDNHDVHELANKDKETTYIGHGKLRTRLIRHIYEKGFSKIDVITIIFVVITLVLYILRIYPLNYNYRFIMNSTLLTIETILFTTYFSLRRNYNTNAINMKIRLLEHYYLFKYGNDQKSKIHFNFVKYLLWWLEHYKRSSRIRGYSAASVLIAMMLTVIALIALIAFPSITQQDIGDLIWNIMILLSIYMITLAIYIHFKEYSYEIPVDPKYKDSREGIIKRFLETIMIKLLKRALILKELEADIRYIIDKHPELKIIVHAKDLSKYKIENKLKIFTEKNI